MADFERTIPAVNNWLESVGLGVLIKGVRVKIEEQGRVSGYYNWKVYLDINDVGPGNSDLTYSTKSYLYLHELGHHFQEKLLTKKQRKSLRPLFGNLDAPYRRVFDDASPDCLFVSPYAKVHPMDDFSETFAVFLYHRMRGMKPKEYEKWMDRRGKALRCYEKLAVMEVLVKDKEGEN